MLEITNTRMNHLIDPSLHIWGWEIPVYLFAGGMVAGMMLILGFFFFKGREKEVDCVCTNLPLLSIIILSLGMFALFLDLEYKLHVFRFYTTFIITSPMSWGSWILILVYPVLAVSLLLRLPKFVSKLIPKLEQYSNKLKSNRKLVKSVGILNMVLGASLGIYTGVLLSTFQARPLWNSPILALLFLVSGLSVSAAFVHMIAKSVYERELLAKADNAFLVTELFVIFLFIIGMVTSTKIHQDAIALFLGGQYTAVFWIFVVLMGIIIPLIIQSLAISHKIKHTPLAPIFVIIGGLILRFVIVSAGQYSSWY
ncbi:MAG: NrfD/PsrC family molybdoenzyme membrane anchor subunit [Bacteroidota bacterium]|nr:NrfD/PsrC family molybdoenzyme membrane anchor subunit [Bacteroidota bacterium]